VVMAPDGRTPDGRAPGGRTVDAAATEAARSSRRGERLDPQAASLPTSLADRTPPER
jgi:hypothetical protein